MGLIQSALEIYITDRGEEPDEELAVYLDNVRFDGTVDIPYGEMKKEVLRQWPEAKFTAKNSSGKSDGDPE